VFDSPSHGEVVKRSAFNRTISQGDNVRLLVNHDGIPLASTKAGTLTLSTDERGLLIDAPALDPANPTVQELVSAMSRGDIDQMSFAFTASDNPIVSGVRELREVKLFDVSVVTFPWYEDTNVSLTGDRTVDSQLVSLRSTDQIPELTPEQRARLIRSLRSAPPGKASWADIEEGLTGAIEASLSDAWIYVCDIGDDWVVFQPFDMQTYELGSHLKMSWKQNADGTFKLGKPVDVKLEYNEVAAPAARSYTIAEARTLLASRAA
jgi:HK97 family phage prohead protease